MIAAYRRRELVRSRPSPLFLVALLRVLASLQQLFVFVRLSALSALQHDFGETGVVVAGLELWGCEDGAQKREIRVAWAAGTGDRHVRPGERRVEAGDRFGARRAKAD